MKKLLFLLMALLPLSFLSACNSDDDIPEADITLTIKNAVMADNHLYVVQDSVLTIESIDIVGTNGAATAMSSVYYSLDYQPMGTSVIAPYGAAFNTSNLPIGNHLLEMSFSILQVDKSIFNSSMAFVFTLVPSEEDLPEDYTPGPVSLTFSISPN